MRVLITGATGGLGSAVAEQFLSGHHSVIGVARSWRSSDERIITISADLTNPDDCARMAREAGDLDVGVHVMGGFAGGSGVHETAIETWDQMMNLNLRSAFLVFRSVLPPMLVRGSGRLIAIASRTAAEPAPGLSAYGASKAGLVHLMSTLALELKGTGVTSNVLLPSTIDTAENRRAMPSADHSRWVSPKSIAKVVFWLAGESAADVSGAVVPVYGNA
jgi:NAD(P)-dependent dehydrogenase (short-subunit alcohol dehydrogenase family)